MGLLLSKPSTEISRDSIENERIVFASSCMQGWRLKMEDAHVNILEFDGQKDSSLFCVFDGHGGPEVSAYCADVFPKELSKALEDADYEDEEDVKKRIKKAFINTDASLLTEEGDKKLQEIYTSQGGGNSPPSPESVGCTAIVAFIKGTTLYIANAGDSRCVISCSNSSRVVASKDHKPELETESTRIKNAGGWIAGGRVNGNLNLTRSIGDHEYKKSAKLPPEEQIITCVPDIFTLDLAENDVDFIILACDGIWDVMDNENIVNYVRRRLLTKSDADKEDSKKAVDSGRLDATAKDVPPVVPEAAVDDNDPNSWPGNIAKSPAEALTTIADRILYKCLAKESRLGIGCDNMSVQLVLFKDRTFGKKIVDRFN